MTLSYGQGERLSLDAADAAILIEAARDAQLRLVHEIQHELQEAMTIDCRAAGDLASWAGELAAIARIADDLLVQASRRKVGG